MKSVHHAFGCAVSVTLEWWEANTLYYFSIASIKLSSPSYGTLVRMIVSIKKKGRRRSSSSAYTLYPSLCTIMYTLFSLHFAIHSTFAIWYGMLSMAFCSYRWKKSQWYRYQKSLVYALVFMKLSHIYYRPHRKLENVGN